MTGAITDQEVYSIESAITSTIRPLLMGRTLMPTRVLANAGYKSDLYYTETDMGQAQISMTGEEQNIDRATLTSHEVKIPIISKDYMLHWRDILSRRNGGGDLNTQNATNAARQVAEEEDKLILTGEYTGWPALGIEGLATATGRNTEGGGDWSSTYLTDISDAMDELETDGYMGPYKLILRSSWYAQLRQVVGTGDSLALDVVAKLLGGPQNIVVSNSLYSSVGGTDNALLIDTSPGNFELVVAQDVSTNLAQLPTMNYQGKVWEAVVPVIKRPTAICEITGLS